jgi:hypothetical protein
LSLSSESTGCGSNFERSEIVKATRQGKVVNKFFVNFALHTPELAPGYLIKSFYFMLLKAGIVFQKIQISQGFYI